jgi:hypothetical protein
VASRLAASEDPLSTLLSGSLQKLARAAVHLEQLLQASPKDAGEIRGLFGATEKRRAELYVRTAEALAARQLIAPSGERPIVGRKGQDDYHLQARTHLQSARDHYALSFEASRDNAWALVQCLTLDLTLDTTGERHLTEEWRDRWQLARLLAERDTRADDVQRRVWGHTSLVELYVLQRRTPDGAEALEQARRVLEVRDVRSFDVESLRRQIHRFLGLFDIINPNLGNQEVAERVFNALTPLG